MAKPNKAGTAHAEALALIDAHARRKVGEPVPPAVAELLRELSRLAEEGRLMPVEPLRAEVERRIGVSVGRQKLHRWVTEAGGMPWFCR